jgi:putative membrane protein
MRPHDPPFQRGRPHRARYAPRIDLRTAIWAGLVGGCLASFTKWGVETILPARRPDRPSPPVEMLKSLGLHADAMTYRYSGQTMNYGAVATHQVFSMTFGVLYAVLAERYPAVTWGRGTGFGLVVTGAFHGVVLPLGGWAPPIWKLPADELSSEMFGHLLWAWTIDVGRREVLAGPV